MGEFLDPPSLPRKAVRPDLTEGIIGTILHPDPARIVLTTVSAGGRFARHRDPYGHFFFIVSGRGRFHVGPTSREMGAGSAVTVLPGEQHGYENIADDDLVLLSVNLPKETLLG